MSWVPDTEVEIAAVACGSFAMTGRAFLFVSGPIRGGELVVIQQIHIRLLGKDGLVSIAIKVIPDNWTCHLPFISATHLVFFY